MILEKGFLETLDHAQLDVLTFMIYGFVEFEDRKETIVRLAGKKIPPDRLELMEKMLEIAKKI